MKYRAEIDGLRAVAVVPVLLFHAGIPVFGGGFVGVDVFFVISGYLITSIILADLFAGQFSLLNFYERRARRILPALFVVMLASIPFAWAWLLPANMKDFAQSVAAVTTFSSNILFWRESGYFATLAELKPLLHTWSLAVEEQYYVFFPLVLMLAWWMKLRQAWLVGLLVVGLLISLVAAEWGSTNAPGPTFYLLPTRGWELLAGALAAFYLHGRADRPSNQGLSLLGLALITVAVFAYDKHTPFPGLYAVPPVLGSVLIVLFAGPGTLVQKLLGQRIFVGIGLISYSLYLWHQPLFAFARHRLLDPPPQALMLGLIVVATVLAYLTWRFVEAPFRSRSRVSRRALVTSGCVAAAGFLAFGVAGHWSDGWKETWLARQDPEIRQAFVLMETATAAPQGLADNGACVFGVRDFTPAVRDRILDCAATHGPGAAILGDSHAIDLFGIAVAANPDRPFMIAVTREGCRPHSPAPNCHYTPFLAFIQENDAVFSGIIFEQAGFYLLEEPGGGIGSRELIAGIPLKGTVPAYGISAPFITKVKLYLEELAQSTPVIWLGPRLEPHIPPSHIVQLGCDHAFELRDGQAALFERLDGQIEAAMAGSPVTFVGQNALFGITLPGDFADCDGLYWSDGDHLSVAGEERLAARHTVFELLTTP